MHGLIFFRDGASWLIMFSGCLRAHIQKEVRAAYLKDVSNIFTFENDYSDPNSNKRGKIKKLWSFGKSLNKDAFWITPLLKRKWNFKN